MLHRFGCALQRRSINLVKRYVLVMFEKSFGLSTSFRIEAAIHTTALHNVLEVIIGLTVTDDVDFFSDQFSIIWAQK